MRRLLLKSILIVSHVEKKSLKLEFDPKVNLLKGSNDTGKSTVIKMLLWTFGAEPHKLDNNRWKSADASSVVSFTLDSRNYSIYRYKTTFSLFADENEHIGFYGSVTNELAPALAGLFKFNLKLTTHNGKQKIPPPAYMLLPFYIDQDAGWSKSWNSFKNLSQYANWKKTLIGYYLGLKPDEWYVLSARRSQLKQDQEEPLRQAQAIDSIENRSHEEISPAQFNLDTKEFANEVEALLSRCETLKHAQEKYRHNMSEARSDELRISAQIEIVARTREELDQDYDYAQKTLGENVGCPTCGAEYRNSFSERFSIAADTETCADLLVSLKSDLEASRRATRSAKNQLEETAKEQSEVNEILARKHGELRMRDIIEIEGKRVFFDHLRSEKQMLNARIGELESSIVDLKASMDQFEDPERRKSIIEKYGDKFRVNAQAISVTGLSEDSFRNPETTISESGSDLPRAILAYFFSIYSLIVEGEGNLTFPIILDAPNQQEQDNDNLSRVMKFIFNQRPPASQLILGLVDDANVEYTGSTFEFKKKYSVLCEETYLEHTAEMRGYESEHLSHVSSN